MSKSGLVESFLWLLHALRLLETLDGASEHFEETEFEMFEGVVHGAGVELLERCSSNELVLCASISGTQHSFACRTGHTSHTSPG